MNEINVTERILDELVKLNDKQQASDISLVEIKGDLKVHMSRTAAVEETNELLKAHIDAQTEKLSGRIQKLEKWSDKFHYLGWLLFAALGCLEQMDRIKAILHSVF